MNVSEPGTKKRGRPSVWPDHLLKEVPTSGRSRRAKVNAAYAMVALTLIHESGRTDLRALWREDEAAAGTWKPPLKVLEQLGRLLYVGLPPTEVLWAATEATRWLGDGHSVHTVAAWLRDARLVVMGRKPIPERSGG